MKCPHCQHTSSDTAMLTCSHCGTTLERGPLEELQHIDYLQAWLTAHQPQLGQAGANLQSEILTQRIQVEVRLGLRKIDLAKDSRELALLRMTNTRLPDWDARISLDPETWRSMRQFLQSRIQQLTALLGQDAQEVRPAELEVLDFALQALPDWIKTANLSGAQLLRSQSETQRLCDALLSKRTQLVAGLAKQQVLEQALLQFIAAWEQCQALDADLSTRLGDLLCARIAHTQALLADRQPQVPPPTHLEVIEYAIRFTPTLIAGLGLSPQAMPVQKFYQHLDAERQALKQPAMAAPVVAAVVAEPPPLVQSAVQATIQATRQAAAQVATQPTQTAPPPTAPPRPAKPARPPIDWGKLWEKTVQAAVSGALLRGLLYLGAFMIVVSLTILVVRFWNIFPSIIQAVFIFSVPTAFYTAGWLVRSRLKLPQAGNALSGIGALLVAVDLAAIYQLVALPVALDLYWLLGALVCTLVYTLTAWRLQGVFFDYVALVGGLNVLLALARLLRLPLEWNVAAVVAGSTLMAFAATRLWRLGDHWRDTARAARYLPQLVLPAGLLAVLFVPGSPAAGQAVSFLLASLGYALLAGAFPAASFIHAAVWSSLAAAGFALRAFALPDLWFGAAAALLAIPYTLAPRWMDGRLPPDHPHRRYMLLAPNLAAFILLLAAVSIGTASLPVERWPGVITLALAALLLAFWSAWFHRPALAALAAGLFCLPFCFTLGYLFQDARLPHWDEWILAGLAGLALAYLGLAVRLRPAASYAAALHLWVQLIPPAIGLGLWLSYRLHFGAWDNRPTLAALAGVLLVYLFSAILHDGQKHPGLSRYVSRLLPGVLGQAIFVWVFALLLPLWIGIAWYGSRLVPQWVGAALTGLGLAYLGIGQVLMRRKLAYRLPLHALALLLAALGALSALEPRAALGHQYALVTSLYLGVVLLAGLAAIYRSSLAILAAAIFLIPPFQLTLNVLAILPHVHALAHALLACLAYLPLGIALDRLGRRYALPVYAVGYGLSLFALLASALGRFGIYRFDLPWIAVLVPALITGLYAFSLYRFRQPAFAWAAVLTLIIAYGQLLTLLHVPPVDDAAAWAGLAYLYLLANWRLKYPCPAWLSSLRLPLALGAAGLGFSALALTGGVTLAAFFIKTSAEASAAQQPPILIAQALLVGLGVLAAWLFRTRWPLFLVPALAFLPVTLFFIAYARPLFGFSLTSAQMGLVWSGLGIVNLLAAARLDPLQERYAHGLYLGGYALALLPVLWTLASPPELVWAFGLWVLVCVVSALGVHTRRHRTWDEVAHRLFANRPPRLGQVFHDLFIWLAAWLFPAWCALWLSQLHLQAGYLWLGFSLPALAYLGLGRALARLQRAYAWPLIAAGQAYTALALLVSAPPTLRLFAGAEVAAPGQRLSALAFILVQTCAVVDYVLSAALHHRRIFAYLAALLVYFPYTLAWIAFSRLSSAGFSLPWMGLATLLLAAGFLLDHRPERYSHGPYLAGYLLAAFALLWSTPDRAATLSVLAWSILLALGSQLLIHFGRHAAYADLLGWLLRRQSPASMALRSARILFLFFAVYAFPVWLALLLGYRQAPLGWQGLALALVAPLYLAAGLALRRVREEYTWPLYSAAYALTAIGAMLSFDDLALATAVLVLDAVVYAVSAYIFRQSFWLYLSNSLVPVITLLALHLANHLAAPWVAGAFMGLAYLYFIVAGWFDRRSARFTPDQTGAGIHLSAYALPFYLPAYLLSALSLAVASSERSLAIAIYLLGAAFYAISARVFRQNLFLYPAAWLAAVPYYLLVSLTPLPVAWYGLGWLPLILVYILVGRFAFHHLPLDLRRAAWLAHPAVPFYLLAYALSISMIALSVERPLILTLAFIAAAAIYFASAALFRRPVWLYPALLAAQLAILTGFTIRPTQAPGYYFSLPFLAVTWVIALAGYAFSRWKPPVRQTIEGRLLFKLWIWELDFGRLPSIGYLVTPSWAQPFFIFALLDMLFWQSVALFGFDTAILVALGNALLLGLFATLWRDAGLAYITLALALLAAGARLRWAHVSLPALLAWLAGIGFGLYLFGRLLEFVIRPRQPQTSRLEVWRGPLFNLPIALTVLAVIGALPFVISETIATAAALAFAGALYLAIAYRGRYYRLGYLALAMLEAAWILALLVRNVQEPQFYAIPGGLYLTLLGYLEGRLSRRRYTHILESFGLSILLVTSFVQSLNGAQGFPYFVLLLAEGMLAIWWGAARRHRIPFFAGLGASVLNVVAQVFVLVKVYEVNRWFIILGVGLVLVVLAVLVERRRERLLTQSQAWRDALASWS